MMESDSQTKVDPRKQALLEARFFGSGREDIEVSWDGFPFFLLLKQTLQKPSNYLTIIAHNGRTSELTL